MASASSSCRRENVASDRRLEASASRPMASPSRTSLTTRLTISALRRFVLALDRVIGRDMGHFMSEHGGHLGRIIGQRQQAARHVEKAAGQRERIDRRGVEDGDAVGLFRPPRVGDDAADDRYQRLFQLVVVIDPRHRPKRCAHAPGRRSAATRRARRRR